MTVIPRTTACIRCVFEDAAGSEAEIAELPRGGDRRSGRRRDRRDAGRRGARALARAQRPCSAGRILTYDASGTSAGADYGGYVRARGCGCGACDARTSRSASAEAASTGTRRTMSYITNLKCRECGQEYPIKPAARLRDVLRSARSHLRLRADSRRDLARDHRDARRTICGAIASCCRSISEPDVGPHSGFTPLVHGKRLGAELGLKHLYVKDDTVNHPTLSYKDRVVSVAITKAHRVRLHHRLVRLDRQPRNRGRGARGARGTATATSSCPKTSRQAKSSARRSTARR